MGYISSCILATGHPCVGQKVAPFDLPRTRPLDSRRKHKLDTLLLIPGAGLSYQWQICHCWLQEQTAAEKQCWAESEELPSVKIRVKKSIRQPFCSDPCKVFQLSAHDRRTFDGNVLRLVIPTGRRTTSCEAAKDANHNQTWKRLFKPFFFPPQDDTSV